MSLRICEVNTGAYPAPSGGGGGVEDTVHYLSSTLVGLGHDVTVMDIPNPCRAEVPYRIVEVEPLWEQDSNPVAHILNGLSFQVVVRRRLEHLLQAENYDVVNFHSQIGVPWSISLVKKHNIPVIFNSHNAAWCTPQACKSPFVRAKFVFELLCFRQAN